MIIEELNKKQEPSISYFLERRDKMGKTFIPVIDARDSEGHRETASQFVKAGHGKTSKFIPNRQISEY